MLKLPKSHKRTFDQLDYARAVKKLESSYYMLSNGKIEEIKRLAPDVPSNLPYYGMTFDEAKYAEAIRNLRHGYYTLPSETTDRVRALAKDL